jgi:phosphatidylinositol glycan class C protein
MAVHVLACDYAYALGHQSQRQGVDAAEEGRPTGRPNFLGGTVSLNAALFSTTLLASRLDSDVSSYAFISSAVVLFAFYPAARHAIARKRLSTSAKWQFISPCKIITTIAIVTTVPLLANALELFFFFSTMLFVCVVSPTSLWVLQRHKGVVVGPWDIAHIVVDD